MPRRQRWAALGVVVPALAILGPADVARAASPFDGAWTVSQSCAPTADDVRGYAWVYPAVVRNGSLSGQHSPTGPGDGSIRLQGRIGADGGAMLTATGLTGRSEYSVGHVAPGKPVHFHVEARFGASAGTGRRVELRQCDFTFTRG